MERRHQPAGATEVLEAVLIAPEVRARCHAAHLAEGVGKVRVNLDLFREIRRLDLNESSSDGAAVGLHVVEGDLAGPDGVLVLVHINACIHDPAEEAVDDVGAGFGAQHTVKSPDEDCLMGVQLIRRTGHEVAVRQFKVVVAVIPDEAGAEKVLHLPLVLEDYVHVALGRVGAAVPATRPLHVDVAELGEAQSEGGFREVPLHAAKEHLAAVGDLDVSAEATCRSRYSWPRTQQLPTYGS